MGLINLGEPLAQLLGTGVVAMGIMNWIGGEDGGETPSGDVSTEPDGGDDLFGDVADDGGGGGDDPFGGMEDGDPFGGMGDDDGFGDMDGGGAANEELENRISELESELAQISSSMNTVRSENEEIAEGVGETEENVRKLLEIYEMVTRGVNPFVDEGSGGMGGAFGGGGDFGLFGNEDGVEEQVDDDLDEDIADAAAESFFADDAFDEEDDAEADDFDDFGDFDADEEEADDDFDDWDEGDDDDAADADDGDAAGGKTFEDLKAEYESGDADWADGESEDEEWGDADEFDLADEDGMEIDAAGIDDEADDGADDGAVDAGIDFELEAESDAEPDFELEAAPDDEFEYGEAIDPVTEEARRDPYLTELPEGYMVDLVVLEWIDSLVDEFGADNASRAIDYYVEINWLSESAGEHLRVYLDGLADVEPAEDLTGPAEMGIDDHIESLTFITKLSGDAADRSALERRVQLGGSQHGLQC